MEKQLPKVKPLCPPGRSPRYEDVPFAEVTLDNGDPYTLKMDIYQDLNQKTPGPCIIYYFGGGWMYGEYKQVTQKAVYFRELIRLVEQGFTVVSPAYRLASQSVFPACIHDCKGVVRFLKANSKLYHIDPQRIGVLGNSAGGHLAAMVAMSANCSEMEGDVGGNQEYTSAVRAATIFYAPADLVALLRNDANEAIKNLSGTEVDNAGKSMDNVITEILGYTEPGQSLIDLNQLLESGDICDPDWKYIELAGKCSPIKYVSASCPPMMILHGGKDPLVPIDQSENLYKALVSSNADAMYFSSSQANHGPTMGAEADQMAYQFLKNRL
ncbi:alpha/beta hydrolase fold domain-containing protein [Priestia megaterium]|jgi:acetyl esterase/lipase|uniref:alpha/beta hydrolase fold domain-containing protein n=1 Tax=Priestia megaterium TaxID=1404 RepID=UPI00249BD446|nr:alpha/beta hydrolase fold domain-containing protein [Priestia megaterium]MDI3089898.1 alpha/beta hydrolase fold domain-containing protein [Priestia megaterium]